MYGCGSTKRKASTHETYYTHIQTTSVTKCAPRGLYLFYFILFDFIL